MQPHELPRIAYESLLQLYRQGNTMKWIDKIRATLTAAGESDTWRNQVVVQPRRLITNVRKRLFDIYRAEWLESIGTLTSLDTYCLYKCDFQLEPYFNFIKNQRYLRAFVSIRLRAHPLEVERGRHYGVPRQNRLCRMCNSDCVEDEKHFMLVCTAYAFLRQNYLPPSCRTGRFSNQLFTNLMKASDPTVILGTAKFVFFALQSRKQVLGV